MIPLLQSLSEAFGPSGCEDPVRDVLEAELKPFASSITVDPMGNLLVGTGLDLSGPVGMVAAHMDEIGFIIDYIDDDGFLRFKKIGGIDDRVLPSTRVQIGTDLVRGVIGHKPRHLTEDNERTRATKSDDLFIDIGAESRAEAERYVTLGDYATFDTPFHALANGLVTGKALDDRAGCAMASALARAGVSGPTYFAFTTQEEIGLRGAKTAAARIKPDYAIVLEATTCADMPDPESRHRSTRLGQGPVLTFQDATSIPHPGLLAMMTKTAKAERIDFQWKKTTAGGNDAGSIHLANGGIPTIAVSIPCRYIHAPCSMASIDDMEQTVRLVGTFMERIAKEGVPHRS